MNILPWLIAEQATPEYKSDCRLPDHGELDAAGCENWVAGAYEGTIMRTMQSIGRPALMNYFFAKKVNRQIKNPSDRHREAEEKAIMKNSALVVCDPLVSFLTAFKTDPEQCRREGLRLAGETAHRELVKTGIALLGVFGSEEDIESVLLPLGKHEEFTFYACPAINAILGRNPENRRKKNDIIMDLARSTDGWGRLAAICNLDYELDVTPGFLLRSGARNRLGEHEAANICATKGNLYDYLKNIKESGVLPDSGMISGICDILTGLTLFDGIHDSINDYKYGREVRALWKELLSEHPEMNETDRRCEIILGKML